MWQICCFKTKVAPRGGGWGGYVTRPLSAAKGRTELLITNKQKRTGGGGGGGSQVQEDNCSLVGREQTRLSPEWDTTRSETQPKSVSWIKWISLPDCVGALTEMQLQLPWTASRLEKNEFNCTGFTLLPFSSQTQCGSLGCRGLACRRLGGKHSCGQDVRDPRLLLNHSKCQTWQARIYFQRQKMPGCKSINRLQNHCYFLWLTVSIA